MSLAVLSEVSFYDDSPHAIDYQVRVSPTLLSRAPES